MSPIKFGRGVAIDGDTIVVGDGVHSCGGASVFQRNEHGNWTEQARFEPDNCTAGRREIIFGFIALMIDANFSSSLAPLPVLVPNFFNYGESFDETHEYRVLATTGFGYCVAIDHTTEGTTVIIGAPLDSTNGTHSGAAYVYNSVDHTSWEEEKFIASNAKPFDDFGWSVAINGDYAMVGGSIAKKGHAWLYMRTGSEWEEQPLIEPLNSTTDIEREKIIDEDYFGHSVDIADKVAVIGTVGYTYLLKEDPPGTWTQMEDKLPAGLYWKSK